MGWPSQKRPSPNFLNYFNNCCKISKFIAKCVILPLVLHRRTNRPRKWDSYLLFVLLARWLPCPSDARCPVGWPACGRDRVPVLSAGLLPDSDCSGCRGYGRWRLISLNSIIYGLVQYFSYHGFTALGVQFLKKRSTFS